jgi:polyisoprenoid-binding protein YceI
MLSHPDIERREERDLQAADRGHLCRQAIVLAVIAALQALPTTAEERILRLDPETTEITFTLGTTSRRIEGSFRLQEGEVQFDPDSGLVSGRVVADATSGDTGKKYRNRNMHVKVLESDRYPEIVFLPERFDGIVPADGHSTLVVHGTLQIHGEQHRLSIQVEIDVDDDQLVATGSLRIPYVDWGLKDPSYFVHRVEKHVDVTIKMFGRLQK